MELMNGLKEGGGRRRRRRKVELWRRGSIFTVEPQRWGADGASDRGDGSRRWRTDGRHDG